LTYFANYDLRKEDLNTLANFARQYENAGDFLDQLALLTSLEDTQRAAFLAATALRPLPSRVLGCAPTLAGLGGTWAVPGLSYAAKIAEKIDIMAAYD
jgi:hypothetical protein